MKPRTAILLLATVLVSCEKTPNLVGTGDETTTSLATIFRPDGRPAAGARVQVYAVGDTANMAAARGSVDDQGQVVLTNLPQSGLYNLLVNGDSGLALLQDSLASDGHRLAILRDTLRPTGRLTGRIRVQPDDRAQIAWIQLLGAGRYLNLDDSGRFSIEALGAGNYTLAVQTRASRYTPTFRTVRVVSGRTVDLGTIDLSFNGVPQPEKLVATWDSLHAVVDLRWEPSPDGRVLGYAIHRGFDADPASIRKLAFVTGAAWKDSLFSGGLEAKGSLGGAFDSVGRSLFYRVSAVTNADTSAKSMVRVDVRPPLLTSIWNPTWTKIALPAKQGVIHRIDSLGSGLGVLTTVADTFVLWGSPDGASWSRLRNIAGTSRPVFWNGACFWTTVGAAGAQPHVPRGYPFDTLYPAESLRIHRFDGNRHDSATIAVRGDLVTHGVLVPGPGSLTLVEARTDANPATSLRYDHPCEQWKSLDGSSWSFDPDTSTGWWYRTQSPKSMSGFFSMGDTLEFAMAGGGGVFADVDQGIFVTWSRLWASANLDRPADLGKATIPADAATVPPILSLAAKGDRVFVSAGGLRWTTTDRLDSWHQVVAPSDSALRLQVVGEDLFACEGTNLWKASIPDLR